MLRCVTVALLLINAYSGSLGAAIDRNNGSLANVLNELADRCENQFITQQIKSKAVECDVRVSIFVEKLFQCLIFYDINTRLCDALAASTLGIAKEQQPRLDEQIHIDSFCQGSTDYKLMLTKFPTYKPKAEAVFMDQSLCAEACGSDDFTNKGTNYYCKYYKWGRDLLEPSQNVTVSLASPTSVSSVSGGNVEVTSNQVKNSSGEVDAVRSNQGLQQQSDSDLEVPIGKVASEQDTNIPKSVVKPPPTSVVKQEAGNHDINQNDQLSANVVEPPLISSADPSDGEAPPAGDKNIVKQKDPSSPLSGQDVDEDQEQYPDIGPSKEESQPNDDDEDPAQANDSDPTKIEIEQSKSPEKRIENNFNGEREFINVVPDGYNPDEDDHFFPFFITVVVIVIALYVLYHNKNRLSKMFFGLVVEGRQSARRRNSRGHAYRRLDTLEQAMSATTAAPPSKIIY